LHSSAVVLESNQSKARVFATAVRSPQQMKLSDAIRMNGMMRPQGFGGDSISSFEDPCAIGGALQSIGEQVKDNFECYARFKRAWPIVRTHSFCPACRDERTIEHCIWHINDALCWTRAKIADWVATVEPQDPEPTPTVCDKTLCLTT
jgi:hypothetical protein